jgi:ribosomal protein L37AE/L43A
MPEHDDSRLLNLAVVPFSHMREQNDQMKCPKCGRLDLRETGQGVTCRVCGYTLTPGENDKFRLYKLLKEEEKSSKPR